jgi:hypothetical protein
MVGLVTTAVGIVVAFLPTEDVTSIPLFEAKMLVGILGPIGVGWWLYRRSAGRTRQVELGR